MTGTWIPVVERELRAASRRRWTYWGRTLSAGAGVCVLAWALLTLGSIGGSRNVLTGVFYVMASLGFLYCLAAGSLVTSDSISRERREGTLGLLFLTDLRGWHVALGKLFSHSLHAVYGLMASWPVLALLFLGGGVTAGEVTRVALAQMLLLVCSLNVGLLASTRFLEGRRAASIATLGVLMLLAVGPAFVGWAHLQAEESGPSWTPGWLAPVLAHAEVLWWVSPGWLLAGWEDGLYQRHPDRFWGALATTMAVSGWAFAWTARRLPRIWQDPGTAVRCRGPVWGLGWLGWGGKRASGTPGPGDTPGTSGTPRTPSMEVHPLVWLSFRHRWRFWGPWLLIALVAVLSGTTAWVYGDLWVDLPGYLFTSLAFHYVLKGLMAHEAPRLFEENRRSGALELIAVTPLTVKEIVGGRWTALRRTFQWPVLAVILFDVWGARWMEHDWQDSLVVLWMSRPVFLVADVCAMAWAGMYWGLKCTSRRPSATVFACVIVLPVVVLFLGMLALGAGSGMRDVDVMVLWLAVNGISALVWILFCRDQILKTFRAWAVTPVGQRPDTGSKAA